MLLSFRPSPYLPLRRFLCRCSSTPDITTYYRDAFARRMAMAGIKPHHRIALGVSGGPDSMALCILTAGWKLDSLDKKDKSIGYVDGLLGIVVDHKLRPESSEEARMVQDRLNNMGIRCEIACCHWPDGRPRLGHLQEAAREMRYQHFVDLCMRQQIGILLIAHHADDQAELLVLRLSRNSGVLGLAGMAFVSEIFPTHLTYNGQNSNNHGILLVRPMLEFFKDDMYKICRGANQAWVEDPTNQNLLFARNRIRASLKNLISYSFRSELQSLISACRQARAYVDKVVHEMIKQSLTISEYGCATIDLNELKPSNIDDLCLSQYLASILQFVSQRIRPIRGRSVPLLMDYIRNIPCKKSLTVASCYLSAVPRSKGIKILVSCSVDSQESSKSGSLSYFFLHNNDLSKSNLHCEIEQILANANSYSSQLVPKDSTLPLINAKSPSDILKVAKNQNLISESTLKELSVLQLEEYKRFIISKDAKVNENELLHETNFGDNSSLVTLSPGQTCHFMSRFLVTWKDTKKKLGSNCQDKSCPIGGERKVSIRHMVDADWLFLAEVCKSWSLEEREISFGASVRKLKLTEEERDMDWNIHQKLCAKRALEALRLIPAPARRALPVVINSQGSIVSIPCIGFSFCSCLSIEAVFRPRVPLGGGYTSYK